MSFTQERALRLIQTGEFLRDTIEQLLTTVDRKYRLCLASKLDPLEALGELTMIGVGTDINAMKLVILEERLRYNQSYRKNYRNKMRRRGEFTRPYSPIESSSPEAPKRTAEEIMAQLEREERGDFSDSQMPKRPLRIPLPGEREILDEQLEREADEAVAQMERDEKIRQVLAQASPSQGEELVELPELKDEDFARDALVGEHENREGEDM